MGGFTTACLRQTWSAERAATDDQDLRRGWETLRVGPIPGRNLDSTPEVIATLMVATAATVAATTVVHLSSPSTARPG